MERIKRIGTILKSLVSLALLALFIWGIGKSSFLPSLRLLQDTKWDFSLFFPVWGQRLLVFFWFIPVGLGFVGWTKIIESVFLKKVDPQAVPILGMSVSLCLFSLYAFALGINGILYWPLTVLFFLVALVHGWKALKWKFKPAKKNGFYWLLAIPTLLWLLEYLSPPLVWDAVLDHFRYAEEVSRLHQIPFHWVNHTGDMPKFAELILAGFWNLGGESFSKLSSGIPTVLILGILWLFTREWKGNGAVSTLLFLSCPFFLSIFAWGYAEGFLAFYETAALYCFWKSLNEPRNKTWVHLTFFFLGVAFVVKYTAVFAIGAFILVWFYEKAFKENLVKLDAYCFLIFALPVLPWLLKSAMAYGNPFYPLATSLFGASTGYTAQMERHLLEDTGVPSGSWFIRVPVLVWRCFFTSDNSVGAAWTPLGVMSLPWVWKSLKSRLGIYLFLFAALFLLAWTYSCTSLRHATGGTIGLVLIAAMAWDEALKEGKALPKIVFGTGILISLWLSFAAQLTTTAPYATALGLEDSLLRLKRHYSYSTDTYTSYRFIEDHSDPWDKVMAFAVFQTYPLQRTAFVDFKWKKPIFLDWASHCSTAEQLARKVEEEGVRFFLYQAWEAAAMSKVEKDFELTEMPISEYVRFWQFYAEPVAVHDDISVYLMRSTPLASPRKLDRLPGIQEKETGFTKD